MEAAGALALTQSVLTSILAAVLTNALASGLGCSSLPLPAAPRAGSCCSDAFRSDVSGARSASSCSAVVRVWLLVGVPSFVGQVGIGGAIAIGGLNLIGFASHVIEVGTAALVMYIAAARKVSATETA